MEKTEIVMDYEKKYNEALKRAEAAIDIAADKDLVKGVATTIFPELRESEDERIRKEIIDFLETLPASELKRIPRPISQWFSWLEKQKESLHISETCKENADSFTDACKDVIVAIEKYLDWLTGYPDYAPKGKYSIRDMLYCLSILEKQKEHQNKTDAPKEKSVGGDFYSSHKDKNLDEIAQDYVDGVKEYNPEPTWDLMQTAVCYGYHYREQEEHSMSVEEVLARAGLKPYKDGNQWCILAGDNIQEGICGFGDTIDEALYEFLKEVLIMANSPQLKEQKPAEWSEEDKQWLSEVYFAIDHSMYSEVERQAMKEYIDFLRSQSKPKQEWSEEDSKRYISIATTLETSAVLSKEDYDANMAWLRNLVYSQKYSRPQPHWKPGEVCYGVKGDPDPAGVWKPSKEQMTNLLRAEGRLRIEGESVLASKLAELYEQLKKLM